jgi:hypothetical protein
MHSERCISERERERERGREGERERGREGILKCPKCARAHN